MFGERNTIIRKPLPLNICYLVVAYLLNLHDYKQGTRGHGRSMSNGHFSRFRCATADFGSFFNIPNVIQQTLVHLWHPPDKYLGLSATRAIAIRELIGATIFARK